MILAGSYAEVENFNLNREFEQISSIFAALNVIG